MVVISPLRSNDLCPRKECQRLEFGKCLLLRWIQAKSRGFEWAWLGVWERNFKAQIFTTALRFERFSEHQYSHRRYPWSTGSLRKHLKDNPSLIVGSNERKELRRSSPSGIL